MSSMVIVGNCAGAAPGSTEVLRARARARAIATSRVVSTARASPSARSTRRANASGPASNPSTRQRTLYQLAKLCRPQRLEPPERRATEQRGVQSEERVLRSRPDKDDDPLLDTRKESVLLGLVETMYLVEEQDRPPAFGTECEAGLVELVPHVLHSGIDCRKRPEPASRVLREQARHRRLARAGRTEEHRRAQPVILQKSAKRGTRTEKMALADDFVQPGGA